MAHAMKRLGVYLGLVEDDPNYIPPGQDERARSAAAPVRAVPSASSAPVTTLPRTEQRAATAVAEPDVPGVDLDPYSIHTIHPKSYNDARRIGEEYRAGAPVIMNLTEMDDADAKRIVDFSAGLVFAMHGTIERVTQKVFLLSPANVDVRDAPAVQQARDGFFNQS